MVLHTLVFTILPVATELGTIVVVLSRLGQPVFLGLFFRGDRRVCGGVFGTRRTPSWLRRTPLRYSQVNATAVMTDSILNYETVKYFTAESVIQDASAAR